LKGARGPPSRLQTAAVMTVVNIGEMTAF
jgi:hypothetical protein